MGRPAGPRAAALGVVFPHLRAAVGFVLDGARQGLHRGRRVALGQGSAEQVAMGRWRSGRAVTPLSWSAAPRAPHPQDHYVFRLRDREAWARYDFAAGAGAAR